MPYWLLLTGPESELRGLRWLGLRGKADRLDLEGIATARTRRRRQQRSLGFDVALEIDLDHFGRRRHHRRDQRLVSTDRSELWSCRHEAAEHEKREPPHATEHMTARMIREDRTFTKSFATR